MNFLAYSQQVPEDLMGKLTYGLMVTIIGVLIVFAVLVLIMLVIYLFQLIFGEKKKTADPASIPSVSAPAPAPFPKEAPASGENSEELVAAIAAATAMAQEELIVVLAAAVAAQEGCDPASSRYRIRSFRRIL